MATEESNDDREKRVSKLWETLDVRKEGQIDLNGLKRSFRKIDHRKYSVTGSHATRQVTDSGAVSISSQKCRCYAAEYLACG